VVDLDNDGRTDVVAITDTGGTPGVTWFRQTAAGWTAQLVAKGKILHDIEVQDLDGDGKRDIVGRDQNGPGRYLHFWRQLSVSQWAYNSIALPEDGLLVTDLNRDGKRDIVVPRYWLKNTGRPGTIQFTRYTYSGTAAQNGIIAVGRVDGDGYADIVVSPAHRRGQRGRMSWYKAPSSPEAGGWKETVIQSNIEMDHHFVGIGDFDRDGRNDIVAAMTEVTSDPKIKIFYNRAGNGTFGSPAIIAYTSSHNMKIIDIDNNGYLSLVGSDYARLPSTQIKLWRQSLQTAGIDTGAAAPEGDAPIRLASAPDTGGFISAAEWAAELCHTPAPGQEPQPAGWAMILNRIWG
jgi:hypothetical protein